MKSLLFYSFIIIGLLCSSNIYSQNNNMDTTTVKDILKEFETTSFENATLKVKDSSLLKQHLIGIKWSYGVNNVYFSQDIEHKPYKSAKNIGIYYTYLHSLWNSMPYFGIQTGINYSETGLIMVTGKEADRVERTETYQILELPLLALFRYDFWKMRLMINLGPFASYKFSTNVEGGFPTTTNKGGYGIQGGGGVAFVIKPIEIHLEAGYKYYLSGLYDPKIYSSEAWTYTHQNQLGFSIGLFYRLGSKK